MPWPTWDQAAIAALLSGLVWLAFRLRPNRLSPHVEPAAAEFALIASLYALWRLARMLPITATHGAIARAHDIATFQDWLHLPSELTLQKYVLAHERLADLTTWYYATVHVPALIAFLVWLFVRHRDKYPHWRNGLALITAWCLVIRFIRVAPPRFLPDLGYVDMGRQFGMSVYAVDPTTGVSDQFAAMPSIHVAWAAVVSFGIIAASTSRWRWLFLPHVVLTMLVVSATGNHWWMDGIVAIILLAGSLAADTAVRNYVRRRSADRAVTGPELGTEGLLVGLAEPGQRQ
ncbi:MULTISPECIES: phosphatase PAP2 family protein [unclassified Nocardioides]|uniref:phosphatase PAP2 family protein n=1 Tax=unclassified Nocardioides TaxID=2615069 RepID=UPI0009EC04EF|nr:MULTISPECIES: phosphatase PAP2 family protein [unclassified Nocardioides]